MEIVPGIHRVDGIKGSHAYLLLTPELTLVDTGLPGQEQVFLSYLQTLHFKPRDLKYIILTHYDIDHVGSAAALKELTGAKVCAGTEEVPYIEGALPRPGIKRILPWLTAPVYGKLQPIQVDIALTETENFNGLRVLSTPGHTPGHLCVVWKNYALVGDLLQGGVKESPVMFIWNRELARESIRQLAEFKLQALFPGHGEVEINPSSKLNLLIGSWKSRDVV